LKTPGHWREVFENEGRNVNANVKGRRGDEARDLGVSKRGGERVKNKALKELWCHPDAQEVMEDFVTKAEENFFEAFQKVNEEHAHISEEDDECLDPELHEAVDKLEMPAEDKNLPSDAEDCCSDDEEQTTLCKIASAAPDNINDYDRNLLNC